GDRERLPVRQPALPALAMSARRGDDERLRGLGEPSRVPQPPQVMIGLHPRYRRREARHPLAHHPLVLDDRGPRRPGEQRGALAPRGTPAGGPSPRRAGSRRRPGPVAPWGGPAAVAPPQSARWGPGADRCATTPGSEPEPRRPSEWAAPQSSTTVTDARGT